MATGQVELARGRASTADFDLKPQTTNKFQPALRIIPSTVLVARSKSRDGNAGVLKGRVQDEQGRPVARALVNLKGFAIARTDSQGNYVFGNVPSGEHQLIILRSGLKPKTMTVKVAAKKSSESKFQFAAADRIPKAVNRQPLLVRGSSTELRKETSPVQSRSGNSKGSFIRPQLPPGGVATKEGQLRGRVVDAKTGRPIPGAIVSVARQRSVISDREGFYAFSELAAGTHQVIARKGEFIDSIATLVIRPGVTTAANFRLNPKPPARFR